MDTQLNKALIQSFSPQLEEGLWKGTYHLEPKTCRYLINDRKMVICIVDGEIGEHKDTPNNIKLAQEFYNELHPQLKHLAQLKIETCNIGESIVKTSSQATPKADTPLTDEHCKYLKHLLESQTDGVFFNDELRAITSLDGLLSYVPGSDGDFLINLTSTQLHNYEAIKKQYTNWIKTAPASLESSLATSSFTSAPPVSGPYHNIRFHSDTVGYRTPTLTPKLVTKPARETALNNSATPLHHRNNSSLWHTTESLPPDCAQAASSFYKTPQAKTFIKPHSTENRDAGTPTQQERVSTHQARAFVKCSAKEIQLEIQQLLDNIDSEIDNMKIPDRKDYNWFANIERQRGLRDTLKNKFTLYRDQFNNKKRPNTAQALQADLSQLKEMQRSMYFAVRSPEAKQIDLTLKGIINRGYDCLPISENQCTIHNQYYLFFVIAYQLVGKDALHTHGKQGSKDIETADNWSHFYRHQLSPHNNTPQTLPEEFIDEHYRGNDFPTYIFGIPDTLCAIYDWIPKKDVPAVLRQPWTAIYVDMNGGHFKTYVKRQNGSIAEINDRNVIEERFKSTEELITFYTEQDLKHSLRHNRN